MAAIYNTPTSNHVKISKRHSKIGFRELKILRIAYDLLYIVISNYIDVISSIKRRISIQTTNHGSEVPVVRFNQN